jgi:hypothetical protein
MKHITKFEQFVNEAISSEVYHFTDVNRFLSIIKSNKINLSTHMGTEADDKASKGLYFLSVSRSRSPLLGYGHTMSKWEQSFVRIQLDGNKINNKYKGGAVDYWQRKDPKMHMADGQNIDYVKQSLNRTFEMEDRLFSDQPEMLNISQYIIKVDIMVSESHATKAALLTILEEARTKNITVNVYNDMKAFLRGDVTQTVNSDTENLNIPAEDKFSEHTDTFDDSFFEKVMVIATMSSEFSQSYNEDELNRLINGFKQQYNVDVDVNPYKVYQRMRYLGYGAVNISDFMGSINADIHTIAKNGKDSVNRIMLRIVSDVLKKNKVKSIKDLIQLKIYQKKPTYLSAGIQYANLYELYFLADEKPLDGAMTITQAKDEWNVFWFYMLRDIMPDQEVYDIMDLEKEGTVNDLIQFLMKRYTIDKVTKILDMITNKEIAIKRKNRNNG